MYTYIHIYVYIYTYIYTALVEIFSDGDIWCQNTVRFKGMFVFMVVVHFLRVRMYVCIYVCMCVRTWVHTYKCMLTFVDVISHELSSFPQGMHACMHVCMFVCMCACMCICMYVCKHVGVCVCLYVVCVYVVRVYVTTFMVSTRYVRALFLSFVSFSLSFLPLFRFFLSFDSIDN